MLKWKKCGLVIEPNSDLWWMRTHAMIPTIEHLSESVIKIYFSGRNDLNQSHIGWAKIDLNWPKEIIEFSNEPILKTGRLGCFDDNGVTPSSIVQHEGKTYLYYIGWNPGSTTRMSLFGGLAISDDSGVTFKRYSEAPIIERSRFNPFINTAPFVLREDKNWLMYYVAGVEWIHKDLPRYNIQLGTSNDGMNWCREGHVCIDFLEGENALARPYVIKESGKYKMWFAAKGSAYRLKYAESTDGMNWKREDDLIGIDISNDGFDSEMMEYAAITTFNNKKYMFYNGNNYGHGGIGLAIEE